MAKQVNGEASSQSEAAGAASQPKTQPQPRRTANDRVGGGSNPPPASNLPGSDPVAATAISASSKIINPFQSEASYVSLAELSAVNLWQFVSSNCPQSISSFQSLWLEKQIDGPMLLRFLPSTFDREMLKEFPSMSVSTRVALFNFLKGMVARDVQANHALKTYIDPAIGQLWAESTFDGPAGKTLQFEAATPAAKKPSISFVFGNSAAPPSAVGTNAPPFGLSAPPAGFAIQPFSGVGAPPLTADQSQLSALPMRTFAPQSALPLHSLQQLQSMLRATGVVAKPWEIAKAIRPAEAEDSFVPGFKRLSIYSTIELAQAQATERKLKNPAWMPVVTKTIVWPKCRSWDQKSFYWTRAKFYECVLESLDSALFSTFKETLQGAVRLACMDNFQLTEKDFLQLSDKTLLEWCAIEFGPKNKEQALRALGAVQIDRHVDADHAQSLFVAKLDTLKYNFELVVNDIERMVNYWPADPSHEDFGELSMKDVMLKWAHCFPLASGSCQITTCRTFIDSNKNMLFSEQTKALRTKFSARDRRVVDGDSAYTTAPSKKGPEGGAAKRNRSPEGVAARRNRSPQGGASKRNRSPTASGRPQSQFKKQETKASRNSKQRPVIKGSKRCRGCGALNNHWGLGFTKDSCPAFGTKHAKKAGFVWPDADKMESEHMIPQAEYQDLLRANPKIQQNWTKARDAAKSANLNALDATVDPQSEVNDSDYPRSCRVQSVACSAMSAAISSEEALHLLGNEPQFFGVVRLAGNESFKAKTLIDPGATLNIISPMCSNRCMVDRRECQLDVFQGKRKICTVHEIVKCCFELLDASGVYQRHVEWFGVHEMGYDVLLGRRFCRSNNFTTMDEKLTSWSEEHSAVVEYLEPRPEPPALTLRFKRVKAPIGKGRFKRDPKCIRADVCSPISNTISASALCSESELSALDVRDSFSFDDERYVLLDFTVDCKTTGDSNVVYSEWFLVLPSTNGAATPRHSVDRVSLRSDFIDSVLSSVAPSIMAVRHDYQSKAGTTKWQQAKANVCPSTVVAAIKAAPVLSVEERKALAAAKSEQTRKANDQRYTSLHPVTHRKLVRSAVPPCGDSPRHRSAKINRNFAEERRVVKAAVADAVQQRFFRRHFEQSLVPPDSDQLVDADDQTNLKWASLEQALVAEVVNREARIMAIEAMPFIDPLFESLDSASSNARVSKVA